MTLFLQAPSKKAVAFVSAMLLAAGTGWTSHAWAGDPAAQCALGKVADLPVSVEGGKIRGDGTINGQPVHYVINTGSNRSYLPLRLVRSLGLRLTTLADVHARGIGGEVPLGIAHVDNLAFGAWAGGDLSMFVEEDPQTPGNDVVELGRDIFAYYDVEFDLANHAVRLFQPKQCDGVPLAYWAQTYSEAPLLLKSFGQAPIKVRVSVNGETGWAQLGSGAPETVIDRHLAGRAGVHTDSPGVVAGQPAHGIGARSLDRWVATFDTVSVGDEVVHNARVAFGDLGYSHVADELGATKVTLGLDFLQSHRLMLAREQGKMYFTNVAAPAFKPRILAEANQP